MRVWKEAAKGRREAQGAPGPVVLLAAATKSARGCGCTSCVECVSRFAVCKAHWLPKPRMHRAPAVSRVKCRAPTSSRFARDLSGRRRLPRLGLHLRFCDLPDEDGVRGVLLLALQHNHRRQRCESITAWLLGASWRMHIPPASCYLPQPGHHWVQTRAALAHPPARMCSWPPPRAAWRRR